jgi:stage V sporulation protein AA
MMKKNLKKTSAHRTGIALALVFALLFVGSAMAIAWFHADVNMQAAQRAVARVLTGQAQWNPWWIALPYALGVGSGVALYYALIGRKTVSPLEIKLGEYRRQAREAMARAQGGEGGARGDGKPDG